MTEKVKLTRRQADAVMTFLEDNDNDKEHLIDWQAVNWKHRGTVNEDYKPLTDLLTSTLSKALLVGYEVEEEYKVGDWIHDKNDKYNTLIWVYGIEDDYLLGYWYDEKGGKLETAVRRENAIHATPEEIKAEQERRVWAKIGRKVGEFQDGDVGVSNSGSRWSELESLENLHATGTLKGFYPAESFISFGGADDDH